MGISLATAITPRNQNNYIVHVTKGELEAIKEQPAYALTKYKLNRSFHERCIHRHLFFIMFCCGWLLFVGHRVSRWQARHRHYISEGFGAEPPVGWKPRASEVEMTPYWKGRA